MHSKDSNKNQENQKLGPMFFKSTQGRKTKLQVTLASRRYRSCANHVHQIRELYQAQK